MSHYTLISAGYVAMSASHSWTATDSVQVFDACVYLFISVVYLVAPHIQQKAA